MYFDLKGVKTYKVPTTESLLTKKINRAQDNVEALMEAADWALHQGQLTRYYKTVAKVLELDPQHPQAVRIRDLKRRILKPLPDSPAQENHLRNLVGSGGMKIRTSAHYILLYDVDDQRADERLKLAESVYETFLMRFHGHGFDLDIPTERLMVVLFRHHQDFLAFATRDDPTATNASGYWDRATNASVFFDQGTSEMYTSLSDLSKELNQLKDAAIKQRAPHAKDVVRLAKTLGLLAEVSRENEDIKVVSHEATHQLAGNSGLLPRHVLVPTWVHEGLATYFEVPEDAAWGGVGAVNASRLRLVSRPGAGPGALEPGLHRQRQDFHAGPHARREAACLRAGLGLDAFPDGTPLHPAHGLLPPTRRDAAPHAAQPGSPVSHL